MNLSKLFEMQKPLRERIIKKHNLEGQDLFPNMNLALLVEIGELANEWRGFKHWSNDREPRIKAKCTNCKGKGFYEYFDAFEMFESQYSTEPCTDCEGTGFQKNKNPLLEEYADCLSFILEQGIEIGVDTNKDYKQFEKTSILGQFNLLFDLVSFFYYHKTQKTYERIVNVFLGLGAMLGFEWEQIEKAYMEKNAVNHKRQEDGY
ncbi:MAG: hypothetical protein K0Q87_58 [Neobacillus sp.]|jgi:dimeric dUTPase (all-alpha-NTP-PPase superfamily)|nr:hypothetical protein [Neobacillus sp.]